MNDSQKQHIKKNVRSKRYKSCMISFIKKKKQNKQTFRNREIIYVRDKDGGFLSQLVVIGKGLKETSWMLRIFHFIILVKVT